MSEHAFSGDPLLALVLASAIVMGSPGPATISVTAIGAAFGLRRSLMYLGGIIVGTIAVLLVVAFGVVAVLLTLPRVAAVLMAASAAYMIYLAWRIATAPPLARNGPRTPAPSFAGGLLLGVANPKAYVAIGAVFAGTTLAAGNPTLDAALKTAVLGVMIAVIHAGWLLAGTAFSQILYFRLSRGSSTWFSPRRWSRRSGLRWWNEAWRD
jgi:threonine/homoserine/homoserine lactone efflux protein